MRLVSKVMAGAFFCTCLFSCSDMMNYFSLIDKYLRDISFDTGESIQVTNLVTDSRDAQLVWNGSGFAVTWLEETMGASEIHSFAHPPGNHNITASNTANYRYYAPCLVKTSGGYALAWSDSRFGNQEIFFALLDEAGRITAGSQRRITNTPGGSAEPSLVWTGGGFGIAWSDRQAVGMYDIYFALLDEQGNKTAGDVRITNMPEMTDYAQAPSLVWTGTRFGLAWQDNHYMNMNIYFALINADGSKNGANTLLSAPVENGEAQSNYYPELVWTGTEFALFFSGGKVLAPKIELSRIDSNGNEIGEEIVISEGSSSSYSPKASFSGEYFGFSWIDNRSGTNELYFACCSSTGQKLTSDLPITDGSAHASCNDIEWTGSGFALVWSDSRTGNADLYYTEQVLETGP